MSSTGDNVPTTSVEYSFIIVATEYKTVSLFLIACNFLYVSLVALTLY